MRPQEAEIAADKAKFPEDMKIWRSLVRSFPTDDKSKKRDSPVAFQLFHAVYTQHTGFTQIKVLQVIDTRPLFRYNIVVSRPRSSPG